jgi:hypothetical protein
MLGVRRAASSLLSGSFASSQKETGVSTRKAVQRLFTSSSKAETSSGASTVEEKVATSFIERNPFAFQIAVATVKTSAADLVAQVVAEKKSFSEIDWRRNGVFIVFGSVYLGGFQWFIMVTKYRVWFPTMDRFAKLPLSAKFKDTAGMLDAAKMVLFDVFIHMPCMYFPAYYTVKELVYCDDLFEYGLAAPFVFFRDGMTKYYNNIVPDLTAMAKLWGPSDCVQFLLPLHIRMPFRHAVSFFWTSYVSFTRGSKD